jgi:hypothetical protein
MPLAETVKIMKPIVDSYQITKWKIVGAISLASVLLAVLGWMLSQVAGKALAWLFSVLR